MSDFCQICGHYTCICDNPILTTKEAHTEVLWLRSLLQRIFEGEHLRTIHIEYQEAYKYFPSATKENK